MRSPDHNDSSVSGMEVEDATARGRQSTDAKESICARHQSPNCKRPYAGPPIANIVPVAGPSAALPASLAALEQAGLVIRGSGRVPDEVSTLPRPKDPHGPLRGRFFVSC